MNEQQSRLQVGIIATESMDWLKHDPLTYLGIGFICKISSTK